MPRPLPAPCALAVLLSALLLAAPAGATAPTPTLPDLMLGDESAAAADGALGLVYNPAALGTRRADELLVGFSRYDDQRERNDVLLGLGGFGLRATRVKNARQYYGIALAGGSEALRVGWEPQVEVKGYSRARTFDHRLGVLSRPAPWLSLGGVVDHLFAPRIGEDQLYRTYTLAIAVRPFALDRTRAATLGPRLAFSSDVVIPDDGEWRQARVRVGGELEVADGVVVRGAVDDHRGFHVGLTLHGPHVSLASHGAFARDGAPGPTAYVVAVHGDQERSALASRADRHVTVVRAAGRLGDESLGGMSLIGGDPRTGVAPLHRALERALDDPLALGVLLDLRGVSGMAQLEELRPRVARLRAAGKPVVAWLEYGGGRGDLYLASACDRIVASPEASFAALGLRTERRYYRALLERWGVRVDRSSMGAYKSAFRDFSADSTPPADREAIERNLDVAQELFVASVAADRHMDRARLLGLLDGRAWPAAELAKAGLIDSVGYREDALALVGRLAGLGAKPHAVDARRVRLAAREWTVPARLAVVYAAGGISEGPSGSDLLEGPFMGSETVCAQLGRAFQDRRVKGVVLRVESPGGSVLASDLIRHTLVRLKRETRKPLVVSMGGVAASGGYFISGPADRIFADRFTVTGSIGVLFVKPSLEGWYARHGVREDDFQRGDAMAGWSLARDWDAATQASADSTIRREYRQFVERMAADRGLSVAHVDSVGQGRVWFGEDARARGLVDELGGLEAALAEARRRAHVPPREHIRPLEFRRPVPGLAQRLIGDAVRATLTREARLAEPAGLYYLDEGEEAR